MDFFLILIAWLVLFPLLTFFLHHQFFFLLLLYASVKFYRRHQSKTAQIDTKQPRSTEFVDNNLIDLQILRAEFTHQRTAGNIDLASYENFLQAIDTTCEASLSTISIKPDSQRWRDGRDAAWQYLISRQCIASTPPPWQTARATSQEQLALPFASSSPTMTSAPSAPLPATQPVASPFPVPTPVPPPVVVPPVSSEAIEQLTQTPAVPAPSSALVSASLPVSARDLDSLSVAEPSVLERTLQTISGWPALFVPFLVQNILWFICGLCFVAGSTSLIASTSGQTNTLAVSLVLLTYSSFLLWSGYRLCRARPELTTSGTVLLALGVLLIPLNIASTVRLWNSAQTGMWATLGIALTAGELFSFYYATMLVSGVMDRFLQGRHPKLFLLLTSVQVMVPVLSWSSSWIIIALTHCVLLGLLAYGAWQFTHDWLQSILGDRRKVGYYAVGTLVYAATVSWVHVTWGAVSVALPAGYASPFLMAVCGLLFYVDAQLKQWSNRHVFLSRINFVLYGLSIIPLLLSMNTPLARTITLCLALLVYSVIVWQYLTFTPLMLLLGCAGWLYYTLILQQLHPQWHLLASLPGIVGLLSANRWLQRQRETSHSITSFRIWFSLTLLLCLWSVGHSQPTTVAATTAIVTMSLLYYALGPTPTGSSTSRVATCRRRSPWLYGVTGLGPLAIAYFPQWSPSTWTEQTASGLILLSTIWVSFGLYRYRKDSEEPSNQSAVLLNSALFSLSLALVLTLSLCVPDFTQQRLLPVLLGAIGSVLLWLSLSLRVRGLFYGTLLLWSLAGVVIKWTYFPHHHSGTAEMTLALVTWTILWWLEHESVESREQRQAGLTARAQQLPPIRLLWVFPITNDSTYTTLLQVPLRQTMVCLWLIGALRIAGALVVGTIGWGWTFATIIGMVGTVLGAGYFCVPLFISVAVWLGLGAELSFIYLAGFTYPAELGLSGVLFSFLMWKLGLSVLNHPRASQFAAVLHLTGDHQTSERIVHWATIASGTWCVIITSLLMGLFTPHGALFAAVLSLAIFLSLAGWHHHRQLHSYLALAAIIFLSLLSYSWSVLPLHNSLHSLFRDPYVGLLAAVTGLVYWTIAWELTIQRTHLHTEFISRACLLYRTPLCRAALFLAVFALNQQLALAWLDPLRYVTIPAIVTHLLASAVLFSASFSLGHLSLQVIALLSASLAVLWGEALLAHPEVKFRLWLGKSGTADQWCTLSLIVAGLAILGHYCHQQPKRQSYTRPISWAGAILYIATLLGTFVFHLSAPLQPNIWVSLSFLALIVSLFPLLQPFAEASALRGVTLPLLSYPFLVTLLVWTPLSQQLNASVLLWGLLLWTAANFILPWWNVRYPQWTVTTNLWPWAGLLAVSLSLAHAFVVPFLISPPAYLRQLTLLQQTGYLTAGAMYCFLMLRNSKWHGFSWVGAFLLTRVGALLIAAWWAAPLAFVSETSPLLFPLHPPIGELLWLNLLLLIVPWWKTHGNTLARTLEWQEHNLPLPFILLPAGYFVLRLVHLVILIGSDTTSHLFPTGESQWLSLFIFAAVLSLSFLHVRRWHHGTWVTHALLLSLFYTFFIAWTAAVSPIFHVPLFLALWSATLQGVHSLWRKQRWESESTTALRHALGQWIEPSLTVSLLALLLFSVPLYEQLLTFLVLIDTAAVFGWRRQRQRWLIVAAGMSLMFLHDWPLLWVSFAQISLLLPWYALQMAFLAWLLRWTKVTQLRGLRHSAGESVNLDDHRQASLIEILSRAWQIVAAIAVIEWSLHLVTLFSTLAVGQTSQWLMPPVDVCAAFLAAMLLLAMGIQEAKATQHTYWVYGIAIFAGAVGLYARLILVGLAPASAWDTTAILMTAYAILFLYHFVRLDPLLHVVMFMPFLLLATIPFQLASAHAGTALISAAVLYLLTHRETERQLPLYLAFATVNAALYLWVPVWAAQYQLVQLYLTPAALSILLLAHLHRHELPPHVLNSIRLAATAMSYVSATSDVFFRPGIGMFLIVLVLSLTGVLVGIASRIRAFLYTGVSSLVCNIGWQLLMLFPEQRLSQAVILLVLAGLLAGVMTWFNLQREEILRRVRVFRTDLETWA